MPTIPPTSIMIVDDHPIVRTGLTLMLQLNDDFNVVGNAEDGWSAINKAMTLRPDVILMDLGLPIIGGIEATWRIKSAFPACKIIMLSSYDRDEDISTAFGVGADGYCFNDVAIELLEKGIRRVRAGSFWVDERISSGISTAANVDKSTKQDSS